ncbi:glycosyltransferase family 2 protein [Chloroflexota bacterium]
MFSNKKIAVVMPANNEETWIEAAIRSVPDYVNRIYVINDSSTDSTGQKTAAIAKDDERIVLISHQVNSGVWHEGINAGNK